MKKRQFNINAPMPSGNVLTISFWADDEQDKDINYMFDALYAHARYNDVAEPTLVEKVEKKVLIATRE